MSDAGEIVSVNSHAVVSSLDLYNLEQLLRGNIPKDRFGSISPTYSFATENIAGYFPMLPLKDTHVLSVAGSGDHLINASLLGARQVTGFDSNLVSLAMAELKLAGLRALSFEDFTGFFMKNAADDKATNDNALNETTYQKLRPQLSNSSQVIFDFSFIYFGKSGVRLRSSSLFNNKYDTNIAKIRVNPYLASKDLFNRAKHALDQTPVDLHQLRLEQLPTHLASQQKYDAILLSNISDYMPKVDRENDCLCSFVHENILPLVPRLKRGGIIAAAYIYCTDSNSFRSDIDDPIKRKRAFDASGLQWKETEFESAIIGHRDSVILCGDQK